MRRPNKSTVPWTTLEPLGIYLNDHLAGASAGLALSKRLAARHGGSWGPRLRAMADEIAEDRATMIDIMRRLDIPVRRYKVAGGWLTEKAARLKLNGRIAVRSPLSSMLELEVMMLGVEGKMATWRMLRAFAVADSRLSAEQLDRLLRRAESQAEQLESMRVEAAELVFTLGASDSPPRDPAGSGR